MTDAEVMDWLDRCKGVESHPCAGCRGFNNAVKCAAVKETECKTILSKEQ